MIKAILTYAQWLTLAFITGCGGSSPGSESVNVPEEASNRPDIQPPNESGPAAPEHAESNPGSSAGNTSSMQPEFLIDLPEKWQQDFLIKPINDHQQVVVIPKVFRPMKKPNASSWLFRPAISGLVQNPLNAYFAQFQLRRVASFQEEQALRDYMNTNNKEVLPNTLEMNNIKGAIQITRKLPFTLEQLQTQLQCSKLHVVNDQGETLSSPRCSIEVITEEGLTELTYPLRLMSHAPSALRLRLSSFSNQFPFIYKVDLNAVTLYEGLYALMQQKFQPGGISRLDQDFQLSIHWHFSEKVKEDQFKLQIDWPQLVHFSTQYLEQHQWLLNSNKLDGFFTSIINTPQEISGIYWPLEQFNLDEEKALLNTSLKKWLTPILFSTLELTDTTIYGPKEDPKRFMEPTHSDFYYHLSTGKHDTDIGTSKIEIACLMTPPNSPTSSEFFPDRSASDCDLDQFFKAP